MLGATGYFYAYGGNTEDPDPQTIENPPEEIEVVQPLAEDFYLFIRDYFDNVEVFITQNGEVAMVYDSDAEKESEITGEFHRIANEYARIVKENKHPPTTLSIIPGSVRAIVPETSLKAHVSGEINEKAFLETIEVREVEQNE